MKNKPIPRGSVVAALDIGSSKTVCFIARVIDDDGGFEILGVGNQASDGVKNGAITNVAKAEAAVRHAVHKAENMAAQEMKGYPLREILLSVPCTQTYSHLQQADVKIHGHAVTDNDVRHALVRVQQEALKEDHELIHTIPTSYKIDLTRDVQEPRGMYGEDMSVDVHLVTGEVGGLRNIASVVERSHLDISALCVAPYASGLASLVDDELDLGATVIDMGGGTTSFSVFHGGKMIYADAIPIGGQHVTSDIARGLVTSLEDAERLKKLYGSAAVSVSDDKELIDVPRVGEGRNQGPNHVSRSVLIGIIQPRLEEIFELIRARLRDSNLGPLIGRRVVLTGGACQLSAMRELAAHVLDKQVRIGRPIHLSGLPDAASGPEFTVVSGLLDYASKRSSEMPADVMAQHIPSSFVERIKLWWRENW